MPRGGVGEGGDKGMGWDEDMGGAHRTLESKRGSA